MFYALCFDTSRISLNVIIGDDEMNEMQLHNRGMLVSCIILVTTITKASVWLVKKEVGLESQSIEEKVRGTKVNSKTKYL